jgi:hypothetical protein
MAHLALTMHSVFYPSPTARSTVGPVPRRRRIGRIILAGWVLIIAGWLGLAVTMPAITGTGASTTTAAQPAPAPVPAPAPLVRFVPD